MKINCKFVSEINEEDFKCRYTVISIFRNNEKKDTEIISNVLIDAEKMIETSIQFNGFISYFTDRIDISINHKPIERLISNSFHVSV